MRKDSNHCIFLDSSSDDRFLVDKEVLTFALGAFYSEMVERFLNDVPSSLQEKCIDSLTNDGWLNWNNNNRRSIGLTCSMNKSLDSFSQNMSSYFEKKKIIFPRSLTHNRLSNRVHNGYNRHIISPHFLRTVNQKKNSMFDIIFPLFFMLMFTLQFPYLIRDV